MSLELELLGIAAGTLTTIAFIPQVIKIWKSKSAKDVSFFMFSLFSLGVFLWAIFGYLIHSIAIVVANSLTFALAILVVVLKIKYDRKN